MIINKVLPTSIHFHSISPKQQQKKLTARGDKVINKLFDGYVVIEGDIWHEMWPLTFTLT